MAREREKRGERREGESSSSRELKQERAPGPKAPRVWEGQLTAIAAASVVVSKCARA